MVILLSAMLVEMMTWRIESGYIQSTGFLIHPLTPHPSPMTYLGDTIWDRSKDLPLVLSGDL